MSRIKSRIVVTLEQDGLEKKRLELAVHRSREESTIDRSALVSVARDLLEEDERIRAEIDDLPR